MAVKLLVLTPQSAFGELIRQSLEQTGQYQVLVSQTASIAFSFAQQNAFDLVILDADMGVKPVLQVGQTLLHDQPSIKLIAIPPNNPRDRAQIDELHPHGYLTKPFYLPDLVESLNKIMANHKASAINEAQTENPVVNRSSPESSECVDLTEDDNSEEGEPSQKEEPFTPDPVEQLNVAEAWFKEAEGKTVPLIGLTRAAQTGKPGDTTPIAIRLSKSATHLESRPSMLTRPVYTSALVPRMPQHYLTGELAEQLSQWVPNFCRAFGWNLEGLKIRPDYMEWIVRIPPALSPGKMLRVIREHTSQRIFNQFKFMAGDNPTGNFWAPGYLIVSGVHALPLAVLRKFVTETRQRQGN